MRMNRVHPFVCVGTVPVAARPCQLSADARRGCLYGSDSCSGKASSGALVTSWPTAPRVASLTGQEWGPSRTTGVTRRRACVTDGAIPWQQVIESARDRFVVLCRRRSIRIMDPFLKMLELCPDGRKAQLFDKAYCYFASIDTSKNRSTQSLTSMLYRGESGGSTTPLIIDFLNVADVDIQTVARCAGLRSVASMYNGRGFPKAEDVVGLLSLPILQFQGRLNETLLASVSYMCNERGCPNAGELEALLTLPSLRLPGQPRRLLLRTIANICHGRGIPNSQAVEDLLHLLCLQEVGLSSTQYLRALSTMCRGKGLPEYGRVFSLIGLIQHYSAPGRQGELLQCFSWLYRDQGLPDREEQLELLQLPALQCGGRLDQELLEAVAAANQSSGLPTYQMVLRARTCLPRCAGFRLSPGCATKAAADVSNGQMMASWQPSAAAAMSGQCQFIQATQRLPDAGRPSPQSPVASDPVDAGRGSSNDGELIAEKEPTRRINEIMHDLLDDSSSDAVSSTSAYRTQVLLSPDVSEVLDWLGEIIEADNSSSSQ